MLRYIDDCKGLKIADETALTQYRGKVNHFQTFDL